MSEGYAEIRDIVDRSITALRIKIPFLSSLLREARIKVSRDIPAPAATTPESHIVVHPDKFKEQSFKEQAFTLAHETMHCANMHGKRGVSREHDRWNIAVDSVVNTTLKSIMKAPRDIVTPRNLQKALENLPSFSYSVEEIEKMSDVELYDALPDTGDKDKSGGGEGDGDSGNSEGNGKSMGDVEKDDPTRGENGEGDIKKQEPETEETIQEGGEQNDKGPDEKAEEWEEAVARAAMRQKLAGDTPAGLERLVDNILSPDLDVRALLKQQIQNGLGSLVINNWKRTSRKHPKLPGHKRLTTPTIWCLIDTSGSISEKELGTFLGAAYEFASRADIAVIPWDADSYEKIEAKRKHEVKTKVAERIKGGGGTKIKPPMEHVLEDMSPNDIVGAMTDGDIQDKNNEETREIMRKVKSKASSVFICTTHSEVNVDGWKLLKFHP